MNDSRLSQMHWSLMGCNSGYNQILAVFAYYEIPTHSLTPKHKQVQNTLTHITFEMATRYRNLPLIGLVPRYFVHVPSQNLDVQRHRSCSVCVQCFGARCSCSLCGFWWNS